MTSDEIRKQREEDLRRLQEQLRRDEELRRIQLERERAQNKIEKGEQGRPVDERPTDDDD